MNQPQEQRQPEHQVVADGKIIYEGDNWQQAFLEASKNPAYGTIIHVQDGKPGATWEPPLHRPQTPL